jgi:hypothetical protein
VKQFLPRAHVVAAPHQVGQQGELALGQAHRAMGRDGPPAVQVELYAAGLEVALLTGWGWRLVVQVPPDARGQLCAGEGFGDDVHRALVERLDPGGYVGDGGQHDDRRAGFALLQHAEDVEPTAKRHGEVEEHQVDVTRVELVQRSLTVSSLVDGVALGRERPVQVRADPRFVVHHQQAGHGSPRFLNTTQRVTARPLPEWRRAS